MEPLESGLQFDFSYAPGISLEQITAFETAGLMWSDYIADDVTINIHVEITDTLPDNVIGGALPGIVPDVEYTEFREAYYNDITSPADSSNYDSLSLLREGNSDSDSDETWDKFEARVDFGIKDYVGDSDELNLTRANAKALGLIDRHDTALDGYIVMSDLANTSVAWDYSNTWTNTHSLDFVSTAVHEIGHVLGFISGVDKYEALKFNNEDALWSYFGTPDAVENYTNEIADSASPLDLFRYSQESLDISNGRNTIDLSIGTQAYFGPAQLWDAYSTGKHNDLDGENFQASHWKYDSEEYDVIGIMDPVMQTGIFRRISDRDLRAMDAIGYNMNTNGHDLLSVHNFFGGNESVTGMGTSVHELAQIAENRINELLHPNGNSSESSWSEGESVVDESGWSEVEWVVDESGWSEGESVVDESDWSEDEWIVDESDWSGWSGWSGWSEVEYTEPGSSGSDSQTVDNIVDVSILTSDRSEEVEEMIEESEVYEGRRSRSRGRAYSRQELFHSEAYFSSIASEHLNTASEPSLDLFSVSNLIIDVEETTPNTDTSNIESKSDILKIDGHNSLIVSKVELNLISASEQSAETDTESETSDVELGDLASLSSQELAESDLNMSLF